MPYELWVEKYRPKTLEDIVGQAANVQTAKTWIEAFQAQEPDTKKALLLSGPPGLGKTTLAHCLLNQYGYRVIEYNASDVRSQKQVEENLHDLIKVDYIDKIYGKEFKKIAIIMDEVDGMLGGVRGGFDALIKYINPIRKQKSRKAAAGAVQAAWGPPIICICNQIDKKIVDLGKDCLEIKYTRPKAKDLGVLMEKICEAEGLQILPQAKKLALDVAQGDYRRLVFFLQYLYQSYGYSAHVHEHVPVPRLARDDEESGDADEDGEGEDEAAEEEPVDEREPIKRHAISIKDVETSREIFAQKEQDMSMTDSISKLLNQRISPQDAMRIYHNDKNLLPMMVHENYVNTISAQDADVFVRMDNMRTTIESIVMGDMLDKIIRNHQAWYMQSIHGIYSCLIPSFNMNKHQKGQYCRYKFTTALSRFSIACTNQKTITQMKIIMGNHGSYSSEHMQHFSRLIGMLLMEERTDEVVDLCVHYGVKITSRDSDLDKLIKIDRFRHNKDVPVRIKNQALNRYSQIADEKAKKSKIVFLSSRRARATSDAVAPVLQAAAATLAPVAAVSAPVPARMTKKPCDLLPTPTMK